MEDMVLKVQCPNDSKQCVVAGGEIVESMLLLGDEEQNMQCLSCGFGSNNKMKSNDYDAKEFTENYTVIPTVDETLKWKIIPLSDTKTEVVVPTFADAFKMIEKMEKIIGESVQQSQDN